MKTFALRQPGGQMDTYYLCKELCFAFVGEETNIPDHLLCLELMRERPSFLTFYNLKTTLTYLPRFQGKSDF